MLCAFRGCGSDGEGYEADELTNLGKANSSEAW